VLNSFIYHEIRERVQIPSGNTDPFIKLMSEKAEIIRVGFLEQVKNLTKKVPLKVMLGDGTVTEQESFDPALVRRFFDDFLRKIPNWNNQGVSATSEQDLRRNFIKFEIKEGNYLLSCHMSLQYHALLYYKLDHRVIEIQQQLSELTDRINTLTLQVGPENDKLIEEKLRQRGYREMDHEKLFELLFSHDDLVQELGQSIKSTQVELADLNSKRDLLFRELDNMLIEIYHTTPVLIDENRMIAAEEGCLCNFNLEYVKNDSRQGDINLSRITEKTKCNLLDLLGNIQTIIAN